LHKLKEGKRRKQVNRKSVVLIAPPLVTTDWTPKKVLGRGSGVRMGLLSIGSVLSENKYEVKILDGVLGKIDMAAELSRINPDETLFVGISAMTVQIPSAVKAARIIRESHPDIPLVWGGIHPTLFPEQTCSDPLVDVVGIGEGEYTCLELAEVFEGKRDISSVKGIMFEDETGQPVYTGKRELHDLNDLPFPNYDLFNLEDYLYRPILCENIRENVKDRTIGKVLHILTGMGCPYRCTFCVNTIVYRDGKYYTKSPYRGKSAARILDEIQIMIDKYGIEFVQFVDENVLLDRRRLFELLDGIEERKLKFAWFVGARANYFNDNYLSRDVIKRMARLGCVMIGIGAESGSQRILDFLKKDITLEQVEHAARVLNENKIICEFSFMIGLPQETTEDMLKTIDFIGKLRKIGDYVATQAPQLYRPIPGGELFNECLKAGYEAPKSLGEWSEEKLETGFLDVGRLPWIKKDNKSFIIITYATRLLSLGKYRWWLLEKNLEFFLISSVVSVMRGFFWVRKKLSFWQFPIEYGFFEVLRRARRKLFTNTFDDNRCEKEGI